MNRLLVIGVLSALVLSGAACPGKKDKQERETLPKPVVVGLVGTGDIARTLTAPGTLLAAQDVWVSAEVGGRVTAKHVIEGQRLYVESGIEPGRQTKNLIALIDPADYERRLSQARASLNVAKAGLDQFTARQKRLADEIERKRPLHEQKIISDNAWDELVTNKEEADAQVALYNARVEEATLAVAIAQSDLAKTAVRSPLDEALVAEVAFDTGEYVSIGQKLARVVNLDRMWVDVEIGEGRLSDVKLGSAAPFTVLAYPGEEFLGTIIAISPAGDPASRNFLARLAVDNTGHRLKGGMFAVVTIPIETRHDVTVVPRSSVKQDGKFRYVFLVEGDKAVRHGVELGLSTGDSIEVLGGTLAPGTKIVIEGVENIEDGDTVQAVESGTAPQAQP
ncbi:MAG: efflux RND transporter periplasmic adaptor subunit [Verrucomicrobia bacterium]|nr:efflux RND transporter periplasmic adaptor subunit [Verrucomicrobiota bacterium]